MRKGSISFATLLTIVAGAALPASGQQSLLKPNWNDAAATKYLADRAKKDFALEMPTDGSVGDADFSLPVLGLLTGFSEAAPADAVRDRFISKASPDLSWPSCAADEPEVTTARDTSGTWYTINYDFGCVHVSINGDLNTEQGRADEAPVPDGNGAPEVVDETGDANLVSQLSITVNRFGLPYLVSIECNAEIKTFCQDSIAWTALLSRLSILDGQP